MPALKTSARTAEGGLHNFGGSSHYYQHRHGKIFSGLTRVVWELNEVKKGDGGTLFVTGSHKVAFKRPKSFDTPDNDLYEDYDCPPGSCIVFTESLTHSGAEWKPTDRQRISTFTCYNTVNAKWHKSNPSRDMVNAMPDKMRTLFRAPWHGMGDSPHRNLYYDDENHAF